ncbi:MULTISPECIES: hypothetical protein [Plantibacter]|uniref:hypothetical protein n=1 Tax=Plantibacter TaxID=190323 RepID=UPI0010C17340|nr:MULTISPECIES: hypothetical protein [Plantibacter]MBD8104622.1 hypothetical protein [Plantibacter sp. CFBP 8775]MBD8535132.1 hypothetical protein [Plantibacter sp. CFBP 13570]
MTPTAPASSRPAQAPADLFVILAAAPFGDESVSTAVRCIRAVLDRGGRVIVWTCGFANWLTQEGHPSVKPTNALARDQDYPSTQSIVLRMIDEKEDRLEWYACRFCSDERNLLRHAPAAHVRLAMRLVATSRRARTVISVGLT